MRWFLAEFSCLGVKVNVSPQATCQFSGVNAPVIGVAKMKLSIDIWRNVIRKSYLYNCAKDLSVKQTEYLELAKQTLPKRGDKT